MPLLTTTGPAARRGADILLDILRDEGVRYIFGNPGTTELPLMDALTNTPDISYVLALQEASAVAMADGYAQAARRPGFLNLHTAGGLGHGMGNLINAQVSQTPLVVTAGQQDSRHTLTDPLLAGDLVSIAAPVVKWAHEVTHADQLPILVRRAFQDARAAPSGPVFLSLPMDVMDQLSTASVTARSVVDHRAVANSLPELAEILASVPEGSLAIVAGDEIHPAMPPPRSSSSPSSSPPPFSARPGRRAFPSQPPIRCGPAISPPPRALSPSGSPSLTLSSHSAASRSSPSSTARAPPFPPTATSSSSRPMSETSAAPIQPAFPSWATSRPRSKRSRPTCAPN